MQKRFVPAMEIKTAKNVKYFGYLPIVTTSEDSLVKHKISFRNTHIHINKNMHIQHGDICCNCFIVN